MHPIGGEPSFPRPGIVPGLRSPFGGSGENLEGKEDDVDAKRITTFFAFSLAGCGGAELRLIYALALVINFSFSKVIIVFS